MAIQPCRECGEDVSTEAETCPSCGVRYPTPKSGEHALAAGFWALVVTALVVWWIFGGIG